MAGALGWVWMETDERRRTAALLFITLMIPRKDTHLDLHRPGEHRAKYTPPPHSFIHTPRSLSRCSCSQWREREREREKKRERRREGDKKRQKERERKKEREREGKGETEREL